MQFLEKGWTLKCANSSRNDDDGKKFAVAGDEGEGRPVKSHIKWKTHLPTKAGNTIKRFN